MTTSERAYDEGMLARNARARRDSNPHRHGTLEHVQWNEGYNEMEHLIEKGRWYARQAMDRVARRCL